MRGNNNNSSSVTKMLNYEQKWQTRSMSSFEAASKRQGQHNITRLSISRSRRTSPKLFNFLDNVSEAKSMSRETLTRLSKCRQKASIPPISDPKCAASGKWRTDNGGPCKASGMCPQRNQSECAGCNLPLKGAIGITVTFREGASLGRRLISFSFLFV